MGQNMASFYDLDSRNEAVLANPVKLAKDEHELCLALNQSKLEGSIGKVQCRSKDSWAGITSRAEQQVCAGRRV
jgi:hypothetical protein